MEGPMQTPKIVEKPWGREIWYAHTAHYAGKVLEVTAGQRLSLQKHNIKEETLYLLSGGGERSDWVRNLRAEPAVTVRLRDTTYNATARVVEGGDESERGRGLVFEKYQPRYSGSLERWRRESLLVAIDVPGGPQS